MSVPGELPTQNYRFRAMIGVGGIGSGMFFSLEGNSTLGREESRGGRILDHRDYCKLHIVSHYVSKLLNPDFCTVAIGKVGDDEVGHRLLDEMERVGINTRHVKKSPEDSTLFSFCFNYPDGSGGNLTTNNSASSGVSSSLVKESEPDFRRHEGAGIALALPEVPLEARKQLLELGTEYGFFRVASFTSEEIVSARNSGLLKELDLLSINQDEAEALASLGDDRVSLSDIVARSVSALSGVNPKLQIILTAGSRGSWNWDGSRLQHIPAIPIDLVSGAGAGDAYLAGTLVGLTASVSLSEAQQLGNIVAAMSATSPHTIHPGIDRDSLATFARENGVQLIPELNDLFGIY